MNTSKRLLFFSFLCTLLLSPQLLSAQKNKSGIEVSFHSPIAPLVRGLPQNQVALIRVFIPSGKSSSFQQLSVRLNNTAVASLERLDLFFTGSEVQLGRQAQPIATLSNFSETSNLAVVQKLEAGLHHFIMTATLKPSASIGENCMIQPLQFIELNGNRFQINENKTDPSVPSSSTKRIAEALRLPGQDQVHTYRIPGLATTQRGTLIAVYDVRYKNSGDLPGNIDVGMSRSRDGGQTWEPMRIIMDMGIPHEHNGVGDPAILFDPVTNKIWVAALWSKGNRSIAGSQPGLSPDTTGQLVLVSSSDDGETWSEPFSITDQVKNPAWHLYFNGPGNGIAMENGTLVFASQYWDETTSPSRVGTPFSSIIYSSDHGKTWKSGIGAKRNTTEAQVVETSPGTLMLNMRDNRGRFRSISTTTNMGAHWEEHPTSYKALVDPVCQASILKENVMVKGRKKEVFFFSNVASDRARINMTIKASLNRGEDWLEKNQLLVDTRSSYGYSALTRIDDQTLGLLYESIGGLYFIKIPVKEIIP